MVDGAFEDSGCCVAGLVWVLFDVGVAGVVVDDAVEVGVAEVSAFVGAGLGAIAGDGVSGAFEPGQLGDVDVKERSGF